MNKYIYFCLIVISLYLTGCAKQSANQACIASITTPATVGTPLTFRSCTPEATAYTWTFGDGSTASGDSVIHSYAATGTYHGYLTVISYGKSYSADFTVTIVASGWIFRGGIFSIDSAVASQTLGTLTATGTTASGTSSLIIRFFPYPTVSGSYLVINANNGSNARNELFVILNRDSAGVRSLFGSTGSDSVYVPVAVSAGKISVQLPGIEMVNQFVDTTFSDSSILTATFTQTR